MTDVESGSQRPEARLVAGIDSSTQATKVVVRDADTGALVAEARAPHPSGTEVDPAEWWHALQMATRGGLLDDVAAVAVGAQQHGMVCLDETGAVVRPALLWNDTSLLDAPVVVPAAGEYVADAARQAAYSGDPEPPDWSATVAPQPVHAAPTPHVREAYAAARDRSD